jgi:hypothetical protein
MIKSLQHTIIAFIWGEQLSCQPRVNKLLKVDNLLFISFEGNNCFIIPKLLLEVCNLGAFSEIISGIENKITEPN